MEMEYELEEFESVENLNTEVIINMDEMDKMDKPITEQSHPDTIDLDSKDPEDIVETILHCNRDIFHGWPDHEGLLSNGVLNSIIEVSDIITDIINNETKELIVISGCGTSGRLAVAAVTQFNEIFKSLGKKCKLQYLISEGDKNFVASDEAEDDFAKGVSDLDSITKGVDRVLYLGITCGLSASYVAGQIDFCLKNQTKYIPVLIGFNPISQARKTPIRGTEHTFHSVAKRLQALCEDGLCKAFIINPILGPEPIAGSSRMKGGTATMILLSTIFLQTVHKLQLKIGHSPRASLIYFEQLSVSLKESKKSLGRLIQTASECLSNQGHIYYIGEGHQGLVGVIDASECKPTFGASAADVRGFMEDKNWLVQKQKQNPNNQIGMQDFNTNIVPNLTKNDFVIYLVKDGYLNLSENMYQSKCNIGVVEINTGSTHKKVTLIHVARCRHYIHVTLPCPRKMSKMLEVKGIFKDTFIEAAVCVATKLILNTISTGAFVLTGKVLGNCMIDVRLSNVKLYYRAIGIIQNFCDLDTKTAESYLLKSIYEEDELKILQPSIADRVKLASSKSFIVPVAMVLYLTGSYVATAKTEVTKSKNTAALIRELLSAKETSQ